MLRKALFKKPKTTGTPDDECQPLAWDTVFQSRRMVGDLCCYSALPGDAVAASGAPPTVLVHGGGQSAMVWSLLCKQLLSRGHRVTAYDARAHGASAGSEQLLSLRQQVDDLASVVTSCHPNTRVMLVGHSMGGAVVAAFAREQPGLVGALCVMDVVEGTAIEALPQMHAFLEQRPTSFACESEAIRWAVDHSVVNSLESARVSIPAQLVENEEGAFVWRTDLAKTSDHWLGWFSGLSEKFISCQAAGKMLVLAGTDRLDTPLTIAQMQGKYQLVLLPQCGHQIHEEEPALLAEKLNTFMMRFCRSVPQTPQFV